MVTGSASGLGVAVRRRLEGQGCRVVGIDLQDAEVQADLGTPQGRVAAMNAVLGTTRRVIDGLVLCAGLGSADAPPGRLVNVNYYGAVEVLDGLRPGLAAGSSPAAVLASAPRSPSGSAARAAANPAGSVAASSATSSVQARCET